MRGWILFWLLRYEFFLMIINSSAENRIFHFLTCSTTEDYDDKELSLQKKTGKNVDNILLSCSTVFVFCKHVLYCNARPFTRALTHAYAYIKYGHNCVVRQRHKQSKGQAHKQRGWASVAVTANNMCNSARSHNNTPNNNNTYK